MKRLLLIIPALAAGLFVQACELNMRPGAKSIFEAFDTTRSTPELAAMAIDPYDANNRYIGTLGLANMPFASEPLYIRLFVDNIQDPDPAVRGAAARGLANHGQPEHVPLLVASLADQDRGVRLEAARGLQRLHNPVAVDALLVAMREPLISRDGRTTAQGERDPQIRAEAAAALGQYPMNRVLQALIAGVDDSDLAVNRSALNSLRTLTGQDFGFSRAAWLDWLRETRNPFAERRDYIYPVFSRRPRIYEYLPFVPEPPNEIAGPPAGIPRE